MSIIVNYSTIWAFFNAYSFTCEQIIKFEWSLYTFMKKSLIQNLELEFHFKEYVSYW